MDSRAFGTHSMRRTKAAQIYRKTGNLRAVQLLLGHAKIESTVRYLGIEVDDALTCPNKSSSEGLATSWGALDTCPARCRSRNAYCRPLADLHVDRANGRTAQTPAIRRRLGERAQIDPLLPFKVGRANGREGRQSGRRLKASEAPGATVPEQGANASVRPIPVEERRVGQSRVTP
jgi:hypothetical protein